MSDAPKRLAPVTDAKAARVAFLREGVARLQGEGRTEDEIATILGISRFAVRAFDRELNPPVSRPAPESPQGAPAGLGMLKAAISALWTEGHSTAEIARRLGATKNSVVGHAHRMNLPGRPSPIRGRDPSLPPPANLPKPKPPPLSALMEEKAAMPTEPDPPPPQQFHENAVAGAQALETARQVTRAALRPRAETPRPSAVDMLRPAPVPMAAALTCQFILNEKTGPGWRPKFCGAERKPGKPYCADHCEACYIKTLAWRH